jgi:hypothetical protein
MAPLSDEQKREFKRNGFLIIRDAIDQDILEEWRELVWDRIPAAKDADSMEYLGMEDQGFREDLTWGPLEEVNEQTIEYVEDLLGEGNFQSAMEHTSMQHAIRFPDPYSKTEQPNDIQDNRDSGSGHIDGWGNGAYGKTIRGHSLARTFYLDRIEPRAAGFSLWPGSHWKAAEYWRSHDSLSLTDYRLANDHKQPFDPGEPFEITGDGGTMILWHARMVHGSGVHHCLNPRMATFNRFRTNGYVENPPHTEDALSQPFKYWEGMDGIELDDFSRIRAPVFRSD